MTQWCGASQNNVEATNNAMAEIAASHCEDMDGQLRAVWGPVADALLQSVRDDLADNWPDEAALADGLGSDFAGQTSDTGLIVSWGASNGKYRAFVIHDTRAQEQAIAEEKLDRLALKIKEAGNLWQLHDALIEFEKTGSTDENGFDSTDTRFSAFDSESELRARGVDICELPTFGGEWVRAEGTWSWDVGHVLAGEGPFKDWEIRERGE